MATFESRRFRVLQLSYVNGSLVEAGTVVSMIVDVDTFKPGSNLEAMPTAAGVEPAAAATITPAELLERQERELADLEAKHQAERDAMGIGKVEAPTTASAAVDHQET